MLMSDAYSREYLRNPINLQVLALILKLLMIDAYLRPKSMNGWRKILENKGDVSKMFKVRLCLV